MLSALIRTVPLEVLLIPAKLRFIARPAPTQNDERTLFGNVTDLGKQFLDMDGAKKFAAWYIDNSEKMSNGVPEYQASVTEWAKTTPLGPIVEAQFDFGQVGEALRGGRPQDLASR
jgi:hypothetical protein